MSEQNPPIQPDPNNPSPRPVPSPPVPAISMKMKTALHSGIVLVVSLFAGAVEHYIVNGGVIPTNAKEWHEFFAAVGGTVLIGIAALLKQSPINPSTPNQSTQQEAPKQ